MIRFWNTATCGRSCVLLFEIANLRPALGENLIRPRNEKVVSGSSPPVRGPNGA